MSLSSNQPDACVGSSEMCGDRKYKHFAPVMNKAGGFEEMRAKEYANDTS